MANVVRFLLRYNAEAGRQLTPAELSALPDEMARAPLSPVAAASLLAGNAVADTIAVASQVPVARWLADHAAQISDVLAGIADRGR